MAILTRIFIVWRVVELVVWNITTNPPTFLELKKKEIFLMYCHSFTLSYILYIILFTLDYLIELDLFLISIDNWKIVHFYNFFLRLKFWEIFDFKIFCMNQWTLEVISFKPVLIHDISSIYNPTLWYFIIRLQHVYNMFIIFFFFFIFYTT